MLSPHYDNRSHPTGERTDQPECSALEVLLKCTQALTAGCTLSEGGQSRGRGQRRFRSSSGGGSAACKAEGAQRESGAESGAESAVGEGATETEQGAGGRGEVDKKSGGKRIAGKEAVGGTRSSDVR